jgi:probable phosphomutase (TIGR03848 family)
MTTFLLIRHATHDWSQPGLPGRLPGIHLGFHGQTEVEQLVRRIEHLPISAVYSSPLERAVETALPIARCRNLELRTRAELAEIDYGAWTGRTFVDLEDAAEWRRWNTFRSSARVPGGESMLEAQGRMVAALADLQARHPQETLAIVSHLDLIRAALAHYLGVHLDLFQRMEINPASVSAIRLHDHGPQILLVNHSGLLVFP